jgi:hypothetical protein
VSAVADDPSQGTPARRSWRDLLLGHAEEGEAPSGAGLGSPGATNGADPDADPDPLHDDAGSGGEAVVAAPDDNFVPTAAPDDSAVPTEPDAPSEAQADQTATMATLRDEAARAPREAPPDPAEHTLVAPVEADHTLIAPAVPVDPPPEAARLAHPSPQLDDDTMQPAVMAAAGPGVAVLGGVPPAPVAAEAVVAAPLLDPSPSLAELRDLSRAAAARYLEASQDFAGLAEEMRRRRRWNGDLLRRKADALLLLAAEVRRTRDDLDFALRAGQLQRSGFVGECSCGEPFREGANFCTNCGRSLGPVAAAPPPAGPPVAGAPPVPGPPSPPLA